MRLRLATTLTGATIALAAGASPAAADGPPSGGCPQNFALTVVDPDNAAAVGADINGDGLICLSGAKETPQFTFHVAIDNTIASA
jgi:hypothetical protein